MVDEPSIVAIDRKTDKVIAVGKRAMQMHEKDAREHQDRSSAQGWGDSRFQAAENMMRGMISMIFPKNRDIQTITGDGDLHPFRYHRRGKRAVKDSAEQAGAKEVYLIQEPMAAALGIGLDAGTGRAYDH